MSYYIGVPLLLLVALAQAAVLPFFRIAGMQADVMLVLLVAWLSVRGEQEALVLVPIGGVFLGLVDGAPMGTALLALVPAVVLNDLRKLQFREGQFVLTIAVTVLATVAFHAVYLVVFTIAGQAGSWPVAMLRVILPTALLNVVALGPIYLALWLASGDLRRAAFA